MRRIVAVIMAWVMAQGVAAQTKTIPLPSPEAHRAGIFALLGQAVDQCARGMTTAYDIEEDYFYEADIEFCTPIVADWSKGDLRPAHGAEMILSIGYLNMGSYFAITRAVPHKAYRQRHRNGELSGQGFGASDAVTWEGVKQVLPFAPQRYMPFQLTRGEGVAYTDLAPVGDPSLMYPLNRQSVVVSIGGFYFEHKNALMSALGFEATTPYMEVVYFQSEADEPELLRAYLPIRGIGQARMLWQNAKPDWAGPSGYVRNEPSDGEKFADTAIKLAAIVIFLKVLHELGGGGNSGSSSSSGSRYPEEGSGRSSSSGDAGNDDSDPDDGFYGDCHGGAAYGC